VVNHVAKRKSIIRSSSVIIENGAQKKKKKNAWCGFATLSNEADDSGTLQHRVSDRPADLSSFLHWNLNADHDFNQRGRDQCLFHLSAMRTSIPPDQKIKQKTV
jgi:hypothetical protein